MKTVPNETQRAALCHQLAVLDFNMAPMETIHQELKISPAMIRAYRILKEYKEAMDEVKKSWTEKMLETPSTNHLRKEIQWSMSVAVKKVLGILASPKSSNRDVIAAARLTALMDGRFIKSGDTDPESPDNDSVATELVQAIQRVRGTVQ